MEFQNCVNCYYCGKTLGEDRVRDHNHYNGLYRGASHNTCNMLAAKPNFAPLFFHNLSGYDGHIIIKKLIDQTVKILAKSAEEYISFQIGSIRFLDSLRFFQNSLENVCNSTSPDDLKILRKYYPDKYELISKKGIFPYDYITSHEIYKESQLPPKEKFHSTLKSANLCKEGNCECITEKEYEHALTVFKEFNCRNIGDYNDVYNWSDTIILADCFEKFRQINLNIHNIDPCYCYSTPGLTWQCGLKYTNISLDYIYNKEILEIIENGIRGGVCGNMGLRYMKANNKYLPDYNPNLGTNYLLYIDKNNLYGCSQSQYFPYKDLRLLSDEEIKFLDIMQVSDDSEVGYLLECDLVYPEEIKPKTQNFPFAPEKMKIDYSKLSPYQKLFKGKSVTSEKLVCNQYDKKNYILHYRMLKFYLRHGMKLKKIHRVISFKQAKWLEPYIRFNTVERTNASRAGNKFKDDYHKLCNNAFYGKTVENIRNRVEIEFATNRDRAVTYYSKSNFKGETVFDENLSAVHFRKKTLRFDKPLYVGQAVLDLSKLSMYEFYYDVLQPRYEDNIEILAMDTDSFVLNIKTEDLYKDLAELNHHFDFSNYPKNHSLYDPTNEKVLDKVKDELGGDIMTEFCSMKSKMYAYKTLGGICEKRLKGIQKCVRKKLTFEDYKDVIFKSSELFKKYEEVENLEEEIKKLNIYKTVYNLNSKKHEMFLIKQEKMAINPFDDKRFICDDGITTYPHGYETLYFM
jgi:hypothetical protein